MSKSVWEKLGVTQSPKFNWMAEMGLLEIYIQALELELRQAYARLHAANEIIKRLREGRKL